MKKRVMSSRKKACDYTNSSWKKKRAILLNYFSENIPDTDMSEWLNIKVSTIRNLKCKYKKEGLINADLTLTNKGKKACDVPYDAVGSVLLKDVKSNDVRLHDVRLKLPVLAKPKKWKNVKGRHEYLRSKDVAVKSVKFGFYTSEKLIIDTTQIICNKEYIIFILPDVIAKTPGDAAMLALKSLREMAHKFQMKTGIRVMKRDSFEFHIVSRHFGLIKNELAKHYNKNHKKLFVYDDQGSCRLLIDNSHNLHEFEAVHGVLGEDDATKTQRFWLDLLENEHELLSTTKKRVDNMKETQLLTSDNLFKVSELMVEGREDLNEQLGELANGMKSIILILKEMKK